MAHLATLTTKSKADAPGRGLKLLAVIVSLTLPIGLIYTMLPAVSNEPLILPALAPAIVTPFLIILLVVLSCLCLANLWGPFLSGSETLADLFRNVGAVPEVITTLTCLTVILALFSTLYYSWYFVFRSNVPTWERQGARSRILYVNGAVAALQVIFGATIYRLLSSVPESVFQRSNIGTMFYGPAVLALLQGGLAFLGFALMVAGPSAFRLPASYEPILKSSDTQSRPTAESAENELQRIPQTPLNQSLAALYQAQQQQRRQLMIETKRKFTLNSFECSQCRQVLADSLEAAELGRKSGAQSTKFDDRTTYWSKYDRPFYFVQISQWAAVLFLINCPIQIRRFIGHLRWNSQDCTSLCYLDFVTPFLGVSVVIVLQIALRRRSILERKLWPKGPSLRALIVIYHFSTLAVYIIDWVFIGVKRPPDPDILGNDARYAFIAFTGILLLTLSVVGGYWAKSLYRTDSDYNDVYGYVPQVEFVDPRE